MITTKEEVLEYISNETINLKTGNIGSLNALKVSEVLNISRSLASQYLNELFKEGHLVKINTRPVCFIHKRKYEVSNNITLKSTVYFSISDFLNHFQNNYQLRFSRLIGYDGSLKSRINQIISSLVYPPYGLPLLIYGENGTGKKTISRLIYDYCYSNKIVLDKKMNVISCQKNDNFNTQFISLLVGSEDEKGILSSRERNLIFIYNAENLSYQNQSYLNNLIETGIFMDEKTGKKEEIKTQIIMVVNGKYPSMLSNELIQSFPAICQIPSLSERPLQEKEEFIVYFLKRESMKLSRSIFISDMAMSALVNHEYFENIKGIRKVIQSLCAKENYGKDSLEKIKIKLFQLPEEILMGFYKTEVSKSSEVNYIDIESYVPIDETQKIIQMYETILSLFENTKDIYEIDDIFLNECNSIIKDYTEHDISQINRGRQKEQVLSKAIEEIMKKTLEQHAITLSDSLLTLEGHVIFISTQCNSTYGKWLEEKKSFLHEIYTLLESRFDNECYVAERVEQNIFASLELKIDVVSKVLLVLFLAKNKEMSLKRRYLSVIIAHGNSTASSISEAVNKMLNTYVFDAIDMPLDTNMKEISKRLREYISRSAIKSDVIILVDMGSLESIDQELVEVDNRNIGIINSVSTQMALAIGLDIINDLELEAIMERAKEKSKLSYKLIKRDRLKDIILFVSDNGVYMANRFRTLFQNSLPKISELELSSVEYNNILSSDYIMGMEKKYNILFITGIFGPGIQGEKFIPIEDLINSISRIQGAMLNHLTPIEFEKFKNNLIRNFSLQNLVSNITVLEPNKLIDFVVEATNDLKRRLHLDLKNKTLVGLYIHISCLVERLVTKEPNSTYLDLRKFEDDNKEFIVAALESFMPLCQHYRVEIPNSEIAYLYDYINNDLREKKHE